jgi:hypothetical protein
VAAYEYLRVVPLSVWVYPRVIERLWEILLHIMGELITIESIAWVD